MAEQEREEKNARVKEQTFRTVLEKIEREREKKVSQESLVMNIAKDLGKGVFSSFFSTFGGVNLSSRLSFYITAWFLY